MAAQDVITSGNARVEKLAWMQRLTRIILLWTEEPGEAATDDKAESFLLINKVKFQY